MRIVCSWCRGEGLNDFVGEKAPFEDPRETHGICLIHRIAVQARWKAVPVGRAGESSIVGAGSHIALTAVRLWSGLKNFTRKRS